MHYLSCFSFSLSFIPSLGLQGPTCASLAHYRCASHAHHTWGLLLSKPIIIQSPELTIYTSFAYIHPFCHYMHLFDLRFCQAGLPSSCVYALRSPIVRLWRKGSTSVIVTTGSLDMYHRRVKPKASVLKRISGRQSNDRLLHYCNHSNTAIQSFRIADQSPGTHNSSMPTQGKEPLMELFSLEDVSYICNITYILNSIFCLFEHNDWVAWFPDIVNASFHSKKVSGNTPPFWSRD